MRSHWASMSIIGLISEVKQSWAQWIFWMTVLLVSANVYSAPAMVHCPFGCMSMQEVSDLLLVKNGCVLSCLCYGCTIKTPVDYQNMSSYGTSVCILIYIYICIKLANTDNYRSMCVKGSLCLCPIYSPGSWSGRSWQKVRNSGFIGAKSDCKAQ